jgi:hypothetical protein
MSVDVEKQLAALGKVWNQTIAHVDTFEITDRGTAHRPAEIYRFTEEEATMIELETQTQNGRPSKRSKGVVLAGLVAAAAVAAIVLVAIREDDPGTPADQPTETDVETTSPNDELPVTVPPTAPPQALWGPTDVRFLAPGTYVLDEVVGTPTTPILVTVGLGWGTFDNWAILKEHSSEPGITFGRPVGITLDACHPGDGDHPGPLTTLDEIVTALTEQRGWIDVTTPSDISVDGYAGKAFQRSTPADLSGCTDGSLTSGEVPGQSVYPPGGTEVVWVLDLDGNFVLIESRAAAAAPAEIHAELAAVLDSIRIAPR